MRGLDDLEREIMLAKSRGEFYPAWANTKENAAYDRLEARGAIRNTGFRPGLTDRWYEITPLGRQVLQYDTMARTSYLG